jgi:hypothetical protein
MVEFKMLEETSCLDTQRTIPRPDGCSLNDGPFYL